MSQLIINPGFQDFIYNGRSCELWYNQNKVFPITSELPARTMRFDFKYDHFNPITDLTDYSSSGLIWTHVEDDIYDFYYDNPVWSYNYVDKSSAQGLFNIYKTGNTYPMSNHQFDVIDSNLTGVTVLNRLFNSANQVKNCVLKHTESVTDFTSMFYHNTMCLQSVSSIDITSAESLDTFYNGKGAYASCNTFVFTRNPSVQAPVCSMKNSFYGSIAEYVTLPDTFKPGYCYHTFENSKLKMVPSNFDVSSVSNVEGMFKTTTLVESGALAMYNKLSALDPLPTYGTGTFENCGSDTVTGAAELAQIPSSWGGTGT